MQMCATSRCIRALHGVSVKIRQQLSGYLAFHAKQFSLMKKTFNAKNTAAILAMSFSPLLLGTLDLFI